MKTLASKNVFCPAIQNPLTLRSTRAVSWIQAVLSDKLTPESGNSGGSLFTSLQMSFNNFAVVSLTWLCLILINRPFYMIKLVQH